MTKTEVSVQKSARLQRYAQHCGQVFRIKSKSNNSLSLEIVMNKSNLTAIIIILIASVSCVGAQEKSPGSGLSCPPEMNMPKPPPPVRADDWVNAWQIAKQTCPNANSLTIQLVDRSGPSLQTLKVFECVDLKASGELLIITVRKADKQEESVIIIRSSEMLRIEVTKRAPAQD